MPLSSNTLQSPLNMPIHPPPEHPLIPLPPLSLSHRSLCSAALSLSLLRPSGLCGVVAIVPVTQYGCTSASCDEFATGRVLHKSHVLSMWNATLQDQAQAADDDISPLRYVPSSSPNPSKTVRCLGTWPEGRVHVCWCINRTPHEALARLPPTLVLTADNDPLRDEGEAFFAKVRESGVVAEHVRYNKTIHSFFGRFSTGGRDAPVYVGNWFARTCSGPVL